MHFAYCAGNIARGECCVKKDTLTRAIVLSRERKNAPAFLFQVGFNTLCPGNAHEQSLHNFVNYTVPKKKGEKSVGVQTPSLSRSVELTRLSARVLAKTIG